MIIPRQSFSRKRAGEGRYKKLKENGGARQNCFYLPYHQKKGIMDKNRYCVIMAGGVGSRFWPLSRQAQPKQFLDILGTGKSFLQQTYHRFCQICPAENILIVTSSEYADLVKKQLPLMPDENILLEPIRRNTGPCIAYAMNKIQVRNPDALVVVSPSDHLILQEKEFLHTIETGFAFVAREKALLTIGIMPGRPETGYGYIQVEAGQDVKQISRVKTFTEKPSLEVAKSFVESGEFLWNAGIFLWSVSAILEELHVHLPEVSALFQKGKDHYFSPSEPGFILDTYSVCPGISIDFGVMEKSTHVFVIVADFGWSDLGTWGSLYEVQDKDKEGNAVVGNRVMLYQSTGCLVNVPEEKLVVVQGLSDFIVVESQGILLICKKEDEQSIRLIVNDVKLERGNEYV
jgi:mannose-1-phosphate guanylyltransferase